MTAELFPDEAPPVEQTMRATAWLSDCGRYRFHLSRKWGHGPGAVFVMLNPSTADGTEDDPTVRRCLGFARRIGCTSLDVVNLFAWRATDPDMLLAAHLDSEDITGGEPADTVLRLVADHARNTGGVVIAAWGAGPAEKLAKMLAPEGEITERTLASVNTSYKGLRKQLGEYEELLGHTIGAVGVRLDMLDQQMQAAMLKMTIRGAAA